MLLFDVSALLIALMNYGNKRQTQLWADAALPGTDRVVSWQYVDRPSLQKLRRAGLWLARALRLGNRVFVVTVRRVRVVGHDAGRRYSVPGGVLNEVTTDDGGKLVVLHHTSSPEQPVELLDLFAQIAHLSDDEKQLLTGAAVIPAVSLWRVNCHVWQGMMMGDQPVGMVCQLVRLQVRSRLSSPPILRQPFVVWYQPPIDRQEFPRFAGDWTTLPAVLAYVQP